MFVVVIEHQGRTSINLCFIFSSLWAVRAFKTLRFCPAVRRQTTQFAGRWCRFANSPQSRDSSYTRSRPETRRSETRKVFSSTSLFPRNLVLYSTELCTSFSPHQPALKSQWGDAEISMGDAQSRWGNAQPAPLQFKYWLYNVKHASRPHLILFTHSICRSLYPTLTPYPLHFLEDVLYCM